MRAHGRVVSGLFFYIAPQMNTLLNFDSEHLWHPYAALKNTPARFLAKSAHGTTIETADGLKLIDAVSSWWCMAHGHNAPEIVEAIQKQSEKMCHVMFGGFTHEPAIELGEKLGIEPRRLRFKINGIEE